MTSLSTSEAAVSAPAAADAFVARAQSREAEASTAAAQTRRVPWHLVAAIPILVGTAVIRVAYSMALQSTDNDHIAVFWLGYGLVLLSVAAVGTRTSLRARERVGLLLAFGLATFTPKYLMSRNGPVYFDEYGHWRHANDIAASGHLNVPSDYLPIIQYYPGLGVLTAALHWATGMGTWRAGQVIILTAHCAVLLLVFFLIRALGLSTTAAFLGSLVYSLNSSFMYFDTEFSYEGLGIALAFMTILFTVLARRSETQRVALAWSVGAGVSGLACIVTHHVSAAFMVGVMFVLAVLTPPRRRDGPSAANWAPVATAMTVLIAWALWLGFVAPSTIGYIGPHVLGGIRDLVHIMSGSGGNSGGQRQLFSGSTAPVYERISAFLAPLIVGLLTLVAVRALWRRRRDRRHLLLVGPLVAVSAVYFLSLPLALTASGSETAHRAWGYGYLGVAIAAAYAFSAGELTRIRRQRWVAPVAAALLLVLAVGNIAAGQNLDYRFPGPAEFGSDTRSRTPEAMDLARWANRALPPGSKVVTDRFTGEVITGYTDLRTVPPTESWALQLYREGGYATPSVTRFLAEHRYRYWIVDTRILTQTPKQKFFQNYVGPESVSPLAIETAGTTPLLRLVHRMGPYEIFWINW